MPWPDFLSEGQKSALGQRVDEIARAATYQKLTIMLGAGFSKDAQNLPIGSELAEALLDQTYGGDKSEVQRLSRQYELAAVAAQFEEETSGRREQLKDLLRRKLSTTAPLSDTEKALGTLASLAQIPRIFTTNYDELIERSLELRAQSVKHSVKGIEEFEQRLREIDCTGVFHLNGGFDDPVITEDDLRKHRSLFLEQFRSELLTNILVMVGYSLRDDAIVTVFHHIFDLLDRLRQGRASFIVMPVESATEYEVASRLWKTRGNIHILPTSAGPFLKELLRHVREFRYEKAVAETSKMLREPTEEVNDRLRRLRGQIEELNDDDVAEVVRRIVSVRTY